MSLQTMTVCLPENIYRRLQRTSEMTRRPLEDVVLQTIRGNLPPVVDDVPSDLWDEMASLQNLNDEALWLAARKPLGSGQWQRHENLLRKNQDGTLTSTDQDELAGLRADTDRFVLRRSYAFALLKWRGYTLPAQEGACP